jgi:hypothetical protein
MIRNKRLHNLRRRLLITQQFKSRRRRLSVNERRRHDRTHQR